MFFNTRKNQKGQAVLIVLLSLSVVLIIVLYIMSRSITDISLSSKEEDSMRAFSAAEAGIERALITGLASSSEIGGSTFTSSVSGIGQGLSSVTYPTSLKSGEISTFWLKVNGDPNVYNGNSIKVCWGTAATEPPAVEISVFYKTAASSYQIMRVNADPNAARRVSNFFAAANASTCTIDGINFLYETTVDVSTLDTLEFMTVKPLYNTTVSHKIGIDVGGGGLLPSQGSKISSDGNSGSSNRSIEVYQLNPVAPSIFMNAVYSGSDIIKI